jgi:glycosyltransferase 2 family protein
MSRKIMDYVWPVIGLAAVVFSLFILKKELGNVGVDEIRQSLAAISLQNYFYAFLSCTVAYAMLAWYDQIALLHLKKKLSWWVISSVSFVAYSLSHNIGASMFTSGVIRYRAYSRYGLTVGEVALLSAFCSFTFAFGSIFLGGFVLVFEPEIMQPIWPDVPLSLVFWWGIGYLSFVVLYMIGSALHFKPLKIRNFEIKYPRLPIALRQLIAAPAEIMGAAAIIYFTLPAESNPGYFIVLGVFLLSFSAGLLSHAPGGLGVFETVFLLSMPNVPKDQLLASLIVFRTFYLLIPLAVSCFAVVFFEKDAVLSLLKRKPQQKTD